MSKFKADKIYTSLGEVISDFDGREAFENEIDG